MESKILDEISYLIPAIQEHQEKPFDISVQHVCVIFLLNIEVLIPSQSVDTFCKSLAAGT